MTLNFENETDVKFEFDYEEIAKLVIDKSLDMEGFPYEAEISLTLVSDDTIRTINNEQRGIDKATDVLSFPMLDYSSPADFSFLEDEAIGLVNPDTGEIMLGDIVISVEHVIAQAEEYGHSNLREYAFLITHSMLHLFGYDHMEDEERLVMEDRQRAILEELGISR